jgi:hypothetical protein
MSGEFKKRFLTPDDVMKVVKSVVKAAKVAGEEVALCGGVAMVLYGSDRQTKDIDFLATAVPPSLDLTKRLSFGGMAGLVEGVETDVIVRDDDYELLYVEALLLAESSTELECRVVSPEYLAAMKLAARRTKDELDIKNLIAGDAVDIDKAKLVIREHLGRYAVDEFESYVKEVRLMWKL